MMRTVVVDCVQCLLGFNFTVKSLIVDVDENETVRVVDPSQVRQLSLQIQHGGGLVGADLVLGGKFAILAPQSDNQRPCRFHG